MLKNLFCPKCGQRLEADDSYDTIICPSCRTSFEIPKSEPAAPAFQTQEGTFTSPLRSQAPVQHAPDPVSPYPGDPAASDVPVTFMPGIILGICAIVFAILFSIIGWACGITGIVLSAKKLRDPHYKANAGLVLSIIGLALSVFSSIVGAVTMAMTFSNYF